MQQLCLYNEDLSFRTLEAYKTLRSNIEFSGKNIRTITVTSCTPNEGKSDSLGCIDPILFFAHVSLHRKTKHWIT